MASKSQLIYGSILFFISIIVASIFLFTNIMKFSRERPFWNTNLGGGYYGANGWPWWNYYPEPPYGICHDKCNCSKPFGCSNNRCPAFSTC